MKYTGSICFFASSCFFWFYSSWYLRTSSLKFLGKLTVLERLSWGLLVDLVAFELPSATFLLWSDLDGFLFLLSSCILFLSWLPLFWLVSKKEPPYLDWDWFCVRTMITPASLYFFFFYYSHSISFFLSSIIVYPPNVIAGTFVGVLLVAARPTGDRSATGDIDYRRRASTLILKTCYSSSFCSAGAFMVDAA